MILNAEELELAACYEKKERIAFLNDVIADIKNMDDQVKEIAKSLLDHTARMSDDEFKYMVTVPEEGA